jgi:hypothetical protein
MEIEEIRRKSESELRYRRGRVRNYPRFKKLIEKFNETHEPMNLDDVVKFMGLTHHTLRNYARDMGLKMQIMKDDEGTRWVIFREMRD